MERILVVADLVIRNCGLRTWVPGKQSCEYDRVWQRDGNGVAKGDWTARVVLAGRRDTWLNKHLYVERDAIATEIVAC